VESVKYPKDGETCVKLAVPGTRELTRPIALPQPELPTLGDATADEFPSLISNGTNDTTYKAIEAMRDRGMIKQDELNDMVRDLYLSKSQAELLGSRLQQFLCLAPSVRISTFRVRSALLTQFFEERNRLTYCTDVGASVLAAGKRYDDLANRQELEPYVTVDLRSQYRVTDKWVVQGRAENLLDRDYETAEFFNQPGRSVFLTLAYQH